MTVCILIVRLFGQPDLLSDLKRLATKTELPSGDRDTGRQRNEHCAKNAFQIVFFMVKAIPHNSKCRYGERGAAAAKPKAPIILDTAKVSAASGGYSEPKQGQRSQSARGFCPRSTMRVPQPDIIEHFGNADAVPQPPERCLSRQAGIVRCCPKYQTIKQLYYNIHAVKYQRKPCRICPMPGMAAIHRGRKTPCIPPQQWI